ncbi:glutaredoxin 3 [uncultured Cardiobacterium sp.]|uniref:glutaredoxin 3 n=1 Tax=uncultured Cardiobacterium sp. TaxID=417619 RepID=UPI0026303C52|nr:glutaredoxin 3 [uncultured Cardiobacterium sp.]
MQPVTMYYKPTCPYCQRAHALLTAKGVHYEGIDISREPGRRDEMIKRAHGRQTVPQIFIGTTHVGGCDDLYALEDAGKLDTLLAG